MQEFMIVFPIILWLKSPGSGTVSQIK